MKPSPLLAFVVLALAALACQSPALPGLTSKAAETATPAVPPVQPPDGWTPVYGSGVSLFLPPGWAGGDPRTEAATLAAGLRAYGPDFEADALALESAAASGLLWATDARTLTPAALTTVQVAAFTLPGVDLAAHLDRVLANNPPTETVEAALTGTLEGAETARLEISQSAANPPRRALLYIFHLGDTFYHITYSAPAEGFAAALPDFEASVRTFRAGTLPGPNPALPAPAQAAPPSAEPAAPVFGFTDDFSDPASGWDQLNTPYGQYAYLEGEYHFLIYEEGALLWSVRPEPAADLTLEVTARFAAEAAPDESGLVGLVCGYRSPDDFFYAAVTNTGYYGLFQVTPEGETFVGMETWQAASHLALGTRPNRLRLDCVQGVLQFWINDTLTIAAAAPHALEGQVGVLAGSFNWAAAHAALDDFILRPYEP